MIGETEMIKAIEELLAEFDNGDHQDTGGMQYARTVVKAYREQQGKPTDPLDKLYADVKACRPKWWVEHMPDVGQPVGGTGCYMLVLQTSKDIGPRVEAFFGTGDVPECRWIRMSGDCNTPTEAVTEAIRQYPMSKDELTELLAIHDRELNKAGDDECECDNTHKAVDTVCQYCWAQGYRHWSEKWDENEPDAIDEPRSLHDWQGPHAIGERRT